MKKMKKKYQFIIQIISLLLILPIGLKVKAAEEIAFVSGIFRRNVSIEQIYKLSRGEDLDGIIMDLAKFSNENPKNIAAFLTERIEMPIYLTSKLMYSKIGNVMLKRIVQIIYPHKLNNEKISIPALRSAVIKGLVKGKGEINLLLFLESYPNKTVSINIPALFKVIKKVESISELIEFFSNSPLEGLKKGTMKT